MAGRTEIRQALETRLKAFETANSIPVIYENLVASPPANTAHLRSHLHFAQTVPAGVGVAAGRKFSGLLQVNIHHTVGKGPQPAELIADALEAYFTKGLLLHAGGVNVVVEEPYTRKSGNDAAGWFIIPVYIPWFCYIL